MFAIIGKATLTASYKAMWANVFYEGLRERYFLFQTRRSRYKAVKFIIKNDVT